MAFHSLPFIAFFLPVVLLVFEFLRRHARPEIVRYFLLIASLFFYGWRSPVFGAILAVSAVLNYYSVAWMVRRQGPARTAALMAIVAGDVFALAFFKYAPGAILPLGFSFYTFAQLAYVIDAYGENAQRCSFNEYGLFVAFFPYVSAGPIPDHSSIVPQFREFRNADSAARWRDAVIGVTLFAIGFFKKCVLADGVAIYAKPIFGAAAGGHVTFVEAWIGAIAFFFQLYFDFSGYSDMAIGLARLFGIKLGWNFDSPYKAINLVDFWRRWHISLSNFLTNYIYTPIALAIARRRVVHLKPGEKLGKGFAAFLGTTAVPCLVTMIIAGVWHGTGWTFFMFGLLHGIYLIVNHAWLIGKKKLSFIPAVPAALRGIVARLITMAAVLVSFVFFNASSVPAAFRLLQAMAGRTGFALPVSYKGLLAHVGSLPISFPITLLVSVKDGLAWIIVLTLIAWLPSNSMRRFLSNDWQPSIPTAIACGILASAALWCSLTVNRAAEFVYFQF